MLREGIVLLGRIAIPASAFILPMVAMYGFDAWPGEIINSLRPQLAVGLFLLAAALLTLHRHLSGGLLLAIALCAFFSALPFGQRAASPPQDIGLTVVWANLWKKPSALQEAIALAEQHDADVIALTEFPWSLLAVTTSRLSAAFPNVAKSDERGLYGVIVFSKYRFSEEEAFGGDRLSGLALTLETDSAPMRLVAIHPPIPSTARRTKSRNEIVARAFSHIDGAERGLVVGDFNTVPWSRALMQPAKAASAQHLGSNGQSTWMSRMPVLGLPLDHAFYRGSEKALVEVGPDIGSDHFPLIVSIGTPPSQP